jgi:hypothetical protein
MARFTRFLINGISQGEGNTRARNRTVIRPVSEGEGAQRVYSWPQVRTGTQPLTFRRMNQRFTFFTHPLLAEAVLTLADLQSPDF